MYCWLGCPLGERVAKQHLEEDIKMFSRWFLFCQNPLCLNGDTYLQAANIQLIRNHIWIISKCPGSPEAAKSISAHMSLSINCSCYLSCHLPIIKNWDLNSNKASIFLYSWNCAKISKTKCSHIYMWWLAFKSTR